MNGTCGVAVASRAVHVALPLGDDTWHEVSLTMSTLTGYRDPMDVIARIDDWGRDSTDTYRALALTGNVDAEALPDEIDGPFGGASVRYVDRDLALAALLMSEPRLASAERIVVLDIGARETRGQEFVADGGRLRPDGQDRAVPVGGDDLDAVVRDVVVARGLVEWPPTTDEEREYAAFFEGVKKSLVDSTAVRASGGDARLIIDRDEFASGAGPMIGHIVDLYYLVASEPEDTTVFLLGGTAELPTVVGMLGDELGVPVVVAENPSSALARGAAAAATMTLSHSIAPELPDSLLDGPLLPVDDSVESTVSDGPVESTVSDGPVESTVSDVSIVEPPRAPVVAPDPAPGDRSRESDILVEDRATDALDDRRAGSPPGDPVVDRHSSGPRAPEPGATDDAERGRRRLSTREITLLTFAILLYGLVAMTILLTA